jgi:Mg-chelatase subunit ChlD
MRRVFLVALCLAFILLPVVMIATPRPLLGAPLAAATGTDIPGTLRSVILPPEFTQTPAPSPTAVATPTASAAGESVTGLVMDVSGSMADSEASGKVKLDGAKEAAVLVLDRMLQERNLSRARHQAGLVTFNDTARTAISPTDDLAAVKQAVQEMTAGGQTNIGDGLARALDDLQNSAVTPKTIILLSDGMANQGPTAAQDFRDGPVARAMSMGVCIHTVGLGEGGEMNTDLLRIIADGSGCGKFYLAKDAFQLAATYVRLVHETMGQNVQMWEDTVAQGEEKPLGSYGVPANQELLDVSLVWPGSKLEVVLVDPSQTVVSPSYPGAQVFPGTANQRTVVQNPMAGDWQLSVKGLDVPEGTTAFSAAASVRPQAVVAVVIEDTPTPTSMPSPTPTASRMPPPTLTPPPSPTPTPPSTSGGGLTWFLLALIAGGAGVAATMFWARRHRAGGAAWLEVLNGAHAGHRIDLRQTPFSIGRSADNDLVLDDPAVSRAQARIHFTGGGYVLEDRSGRGSTYVNGQRVLQATLQPGDRIRLGDVEFAFGRR